MALVGLRSRAGVSEIQQCVEQWLHQPMEQGLACSTSYSFSKLWCGEAFHELGAQSADVSALPGALPQSSVSPASQQSPWIRKSVAVSGSPSCIPIRELFQ
jgi:hypothetical protein